MQLLLYWSGKEKTTRQLMRNKNMGGMDYTAATIYLESRHTCHISSFIDPVQNQSSVLVKIFQTVAVMEENLGRGPLLL